MRATLLIPTPGFIAEYGPVLFIERVKAHMLPPMGRLYFAPIEDEL